MSDKIRIPVFSPDGKEVGGLDIDPASFGGEVNKQLLHDAVVMYQANKRAGTAKTKTRAEVIGSGKKLFRQKGTGNARVGTKRTNKRRGGGTANQRRVRTSIVVPRPNAKHVMIEYRDRPGISKSVRGSGFPKHRRG